MRKNHNTFNTLLKHSFFFISLTLSSLTIDTNAAQVPADVTLAPAKDQAITIANGSEPESIDPQMVQGTPGSFIVRELFEGLVREDAKGNPAPGIASSWTVSDDGLTYTFNLRKSKWSDGSSLTADDFVFAWRRAVDPAVHSQYAWFIATGNLVNAQAIIDGKKAPSTLGVKAISPYKLQITVNSPTPYLVSMLSQPTFAPAPEKVVKKLGKDWVKPGNMVSNGAYKLDSWVVNGHVTLTRNTLYWDNAHTVINKVTFLPVRDNNALNQYKAGRVNIVDSNTYLAKQEFSYYKKHHPEELKVSPMLSTYYYDINIKKPPFTDVRVRQALSLSVDRNVLTKYVTGRGETPTCDFLPPFIAHYAKPASDCADMGQKERIEQAKKLLKEAGFGPSNPLSLTITYNTDQNHKNVAVAISRMWQAIGVNAKIENQEWKTFLSTRKAGQYEIARDGWIADYNDPSNFLDLLMSDNPQNNPHWKNSTYDQLVSKADHSTHPEARAEIYKKAQEIMLKDAPIIPLYTYVNSALVKPDIRGFVVSRPDSRFFSREMYVVKNSH